MKAKKSLTFDALRRANIQRLPLFRNRSGQILHTAPDGSDWSIEKWFNAVVGEVGEYAGKKKDHDRGDISYAVFVEEAGKEIADIVTYLDLLAFRLGLSLDDIVQAKWNEVSRRVQAPIELTADGPIPAPHFVKRPSAKPPKKTKSHHISTTKYGKPT